MEFEDLTKEWEEECHALECPACHSYCLRAVRAIRALWRALQEEPYDQRDIEFIIGIIELVKDKKTKLVVNP